MTEPYDEFTINGISPTWIVSIDEQLPKITLHCAARAGNDFLYAQDEINQFKAMAAHTINNEDLGDGGTDLQISMDGEIVTITNGTNSYTGALTYPKFKNEAKWVRNPDGTMSKLIKWDIDIIVQLENAAQNTTSMIYSPDFRLYSNINYNTWTEDIPTETGGTVSAFPGTVTQTSTTGKSSWVNLDNIKADDTNLATNPSTISADISGTSQLITCTDFGFDSLIPSNMIITRLQLVIKYANQSQSPYYYNSHQFINMNLRLNGISKPLIQSTPDNLQTLTLDSLDGSIPTFSTDPTHYNDSNFSVTCDMDLTKYHQAWIDDIKVIITYAPITLDYTLDPNAANGEEIGRMTIYETRAVNKVELTGSACNLPATITVNGITQDWHYSHDHNTGDTGTDGEEPLAFVIDPPSKIITISTSNHMPPIYSGGVWSNSASNNSGCKLKQIQVFYS